jgi:nucleoside-diphosphate-sugar epimerase
MAQAERATLMNIAITGGTGFVGRHLARALSAEGHSVLLLGRGLDRRDPSIYEVAGTRFAATDLQDQELLAELLRGCHAIAHCAGINREIGRQTYQRVHVEGTRNVLAAARAAGVPKIVLLSFLRARPDCGSAYHESKWAAEQLVRDSGLDYTVFKAGMIYGRGDHMLDHLSHALHTAPVFATVGLRERPIRPLAIADLVRAIQAALVDGRLLRQTVAITGAEELLLSEAVRRVAHVLGKRVLVFPAPVWVHRALARVFERTMKVPLVAKAQVHILSEGVVEPAPFADPLPPDLLPVLRFTGEQIRGGLPAPGAFGVRDLRCCLAQ